MKKEDILQRLSLVLGALNSVTVCGKANLANLSGSIAMLEEVEKMIRGADDPEQSKASAEI